MPAIQPPVAQIIYSFHLQYEIFNQFLSAIASGYIVLHSRYSIRKDLRYEDLIWLSHIYPPHRVTMAPLNRHLE